MYRDHFHHHDLRNVRPSTRSLILKGKSVLPFFLVPMFLLHFGLYCNACLGILFVSVLCFKPPVPDSTLGTGLPEM